MMKGHGKYEKMIIIHPGERHHEDSENDGWSLWTATRKPGELSASSNCAKAPRRRCRTILSKIS
jgi:hypothetical protein